MRRGGLAWVAMAAACWWAGLLCSSANSASALPASAWVVVLPARMAAETKTDTPPKAPPLSPKPVAGGTPRAAAPTDPLFLEDPVEPLVPARPRSEADADRLEALTLFSCARLHELRDEEVQALRLYQRAFRRDPQSAVIARAIVPLAARLDRHFEAVRYALKLAEIDTPDPEMLTRLGVILAQTGELAQAAAMLEKASQARATGQPTPTDLHLWLELGRLYFRLGQFAQAATWFSRLSEALEHPERFGLAAAARKAVLSHPAEVYGLMGEAFLRAGQLENARHAFEQAHRAGPRPARLAWQLARLELRSANPRQALVRLEEAFRASPSSEDLAPETVWPEILQALSHQPELIPRLEKLRAALPDNVPLGYFLAEAYRHAGRLDQAESLYRACLARTPQSFGYRGLTEIYCKRQQYGELLEVLGRAIQQQGSLESLGELQKTVLDDKPLLRGVVDHARRRLKEGHPPAPPQTLAAALLAAEAKQWDDAEVLFDHSVSRSPERAGDILLTWGLGLILADQYARAVPVLRRGTDPKLAPELTHLFCFYLAGALEMTGNTEEALSMARRAVELARARDAAEAAKNKDFRPVWGEAPRFELRRAWILSHARRHRDAMRAYEEIIRKYDGEHGWPPLRQVLREARLALSNLAVLEGDLPAAEEWLEQVLDEFPDDASALNDLGYLWADRGKHLARAECMIRRALEQEPGNAAFRDSLGWVLFRQGRVEEALPQLEKAAADEPDPTVLDHLGDVYWKLGRSREARSAWERAAKAHRQAGEPAKAASIEKKLAAPSPSAGGATILRSPHAFYM